MPDIKEIDIDRQLKAGRPSAVYLIYGDDRYRKQLAATKLIEGLMPAQMPDVNYRRFVGGRDKLADVRDTCTRPPMLDDLCLTVMEDYPIDRPESKDAAVFAEIMKDLPDRCVLIIWQNDAETDTRKPAFANVLKWARDRGSALRLDIPTANETARMLCELAESKGTRLSMTDASYMVKRCGRDMMLLSSELEKLIIYAGRRSINQQMIDEVCPASLEADIYRISKNILWGRPGDAIVIAGSLMLQRANPIEIFTVLSQSFTDLYRAKCAALSGKTADDLKKLYAADYPRSRAFRADNAMRDQKDYPIQQLRQYIELLIGAELRFKGGRCDKRTALEQLIVRLSLVRRGGSR